MIGSEITCRNATMYEGMLTRGRMYRVLDVDDSKRVVKIESDNGRIRLFPFCCFGLEGEVVPMLLDWNFDDNIEDTKREDFLTWVEVSFNLSDGMRRWCKIITPEGLSKILNLPNVNPPGIYVPNLIVVRSYNSSDIDNVLRYLDENDELVKASLPYKKTKQTSRSMDV